jgi:hypothetical protein
MIWPATAIPTIHKPRFDLQKVTRMKKVYTITADVKTPTPKISEILNNIDVDDNILIEFEKGKYVFSREGLEKHRIFSSSTKSGENYVLFPIKNKSNITIDGGGSEFIFCDRLQPFLFENCRNVELKNFSLDYSFLRYAYGNVVSISEAGFEIAIDKAKNADFVICLFDGLTDDIQVFENIKNNISGKKLFVANKKDKLSQSRITELENKDCLVISVKNNKDINFLLQCIEKEIKKSFSSGTGAVITRRRYRDSLQSALQNLNRFGFNKDIELTAEDIRLAARELGKITGRIEVDDILDKIFGSFCIGK